MSKPTAPPVYRPQPIPRVLQRKVPAAQQQQQQRPAPTPPPVYRPQPAPHVLQRKANAQPPRPPSTPPVRPATAPPVYRPQPTPHVLQRKAATAQPQPPAGVPRPRPIAPPANRPGRNGIAQPKTSMAAPTRTPSKAPGTVIQRVIKEASEDVRSQVSKELNNAANKIKAYLQNSGNERYMSKLTDYADKFLGFSTSRQIDSYVIPAMQKVYEYLTETRFSLYTDTGVNAYAYVYPDDPQKIYLGKSFNGVGYSRTDSVAGVLLHEITHLVLGTDDHGYGNENIGKMAKAENKKEARNNADNWERFFEGLLFQ